MAGALAPCALLALCVAVVDGSVTFPSAAPGSPLAGVHLYSAAMTSFIGPQPGDPDSTRTGPVVIFDGDLCQPSTMQAPGSIIFITTGSATRAACSYETRYLSLYVTGAAAILLPAVDNVPSVQMYTNDGSQGAYTRHLPTLFLHVGPSNEVYNTVVSAAPGQNATVSPDANVWQDTFASWYYQLFIRILPSFVLIASGLTASVYLAVHMRFMRGEYESTFPVARRSLSRWMAFARKSAGLPHAVLAIEVATATLSGAILAIDGYFSTPNLPFPVLQYFITLLSGWSFASSLLSASVWVRHLSCIVDSKSLLTRVVRGDYLSVFVLLAVIPIIVDTAGSVLFAMYHGQLAVTTIISALGFLLQLTVGVHVLTSVMHYYCTVRKVFVQTTHAASDADEGMDAILRRLSVCALGMSLSMILFCFGTALIALSSASLYSPARWTAIWSLIYSGRAADSAFRVAMFKPRSAQPSFKHNVIAVTPDTKKTWASLSTPLHQ